MREPPPTTVGGGGEQRGKSLKLPACFHLTGEGREGKFTHARNFIFQLSHIFPSFF